MGLFGSASKIVTVAPIASRACDSTRVSVLLLAPPFELAVIMIGNSTSCQADTNLLYSFIKLLNGRKVYILLHISIQVRGEGRSRYSKSSGRNDSSTPLQVEANWQADAVPAIL